MFGEENEEQAPADALIPSEPIYLDPDPMLAYFPETQTETYAMPTDVLEEESNKKRSSMSTEEKREKWRACYRRKIEKYGHEHHRKIWRAWAARQDPEKLKQKKREAERRRYWRDKEQKGARPRVTTESTKQKARIRAQRFREKHGKNRKTPAPTVAVPGVSSDATETEMAILMRMEPAARKQYCESEIRKVNVLLAVPGFVLGEDALRIHIARERVLARIQEEEEKEEDPQQPERSAYEEREERLMARVRALEQIRKSDQEEKQRAQEEKQRTKEEARVYAEQQREREEVRRAMVERTRLQQQERQQEMERLRMERLTKISTAR